jgi:hypothetical protein
MIPDETARRLIEECQRRKAVGDAMLKMLRAIANTEKHERDGQDITADTMRTFARAAIAQAESEL